MKNPTLSEDKSDVIFKTKEKKGSVKFTTILFYMYSAIHCSVFLFLMALFDNQRFAVLHREPAFISIALLGFAIPFALRFKNKIRNFIVYVVLTVSVTIGGFGVYADFTEDTIPNTVSKTHSYVLNFINTEKNMYYERQAQKAASLANQQKSKEKDNSKNIFQIISGGEANTLVKAIINSPHGMSAFVYSKALYGSNSYIKTIAEGEKAWTYMILFAICFQLWLHATKNGVELLQAMKETKFFGFIGIVFFFLFCAVIIGFFLSFLTGNESAMHSAIAAGFLSGFLLKIQAHLYFDKNNNKGSIFYFSFGLPIFTHIVATMLSSIKGFGHFSFAGGYWIEKLGVTGALCVVIFMFAFFKINDMYDDYAARKR
ncbi:hypothetical protein [Vibrio sp. OPT18]|uniref:hypothetical protein n=1 Tax=Vibrio sp. OPT18 TaxID=2778641 RepID=UPI001882F15B|nr:hypothetical protein [Vibrio sp. OPT18]MBE8577601.1 hypothetical protein [Vibrio sp. OPT18]